MAEALVSTQWVADNLNKIRLVEVDVDTTQYEASHAPGAVAFNWQTQLQDQVARDILSKEAFASLLGQAGITPDTHVVLYGDNNNWFAAYAFWQFKYYGLLYGDNNNWFAAYAFWQFKYYGHENVSLMNGGRKKWLEEGRPVTTDVPSNAPTNYTVQKVNPEIRADRDYIKSRLGTQGFGLVDVRSPAEYVGDIIAPPGMTETAQRPGHIPGASNIPWSQAVAEDGTFKSPEQLKELYAGKGITGNNNEIVAYCRIGERSSHSWFALTYILGYKNVRNYDGSWTEWGNLVGSPIKKGSEP
jgi:thiosulfate/3-mercaptopyruvate sulfurtransferase